MNGTKEKSKQNDRCCPYCQSQDVIVGENGSGYCKACSKSFVKFFTARKCPGCGDTRLKGLEIDEGKQVFCEGCGEHIPLSYYIDNEYECSGCGALACADDVICRGCGEKIIDAEPKSKINYWLMIFGAVVYFVFSVIPWLYTPEIRNLINYIRVTKALEIFGIITFMYGCIKQIKDKV